MSTSHAFKAGWQDKLLALPVPPKYERCRTGLALAYERGRHCAALYEWEATADGGTITVEYTARGAALTPTYAKAYRRMSPALRKLIREERKFCALKPRKWSV